MAREKHLDFVIYEDEDARVKMRFYPQKSDMHYSDYCWSILESENDSWDDKEADWSAFREIFGFYCDEDSPLAYLDEAIDFLLNKEDDKIRLKPFGQPASIWNMYYKEGTSFNEKTHSFEHDPTQDCILFEVWNNLTNAGYRFFLQVKKAIEFREYIKAIRQCAPKPAENK